MDGTNSGEKILPPGAGKVILLVDDEEMIRKLVRKLLADRSYTVLEAAGGPAALEVARSPDVRLDLLITDVMMPSLNGHDLAGELCTRQPWLKVLFISGFAGEPLAAALQGLTADFLAKPFSAEELLGKVEQLLAGPG